ncbi:bis(5'-nucleosyl)-tetraphosphatase PrpE [Alkalicoccus halolimnae]|uniref:Bis(5'-nucleosyl)-tetraphosphatase PrpE n=1 Tax=Alkalicoccus halolimnae TaxID=1667239 RepID=A0A5C7F1Z0_9BACI|nr:bis(5'-nucleosyl)-tetraphosphatase PrpE [Alkalicoccus halolimnae]TXF82528.1 bis(5'-nucleosyl)-tetraphosphatase PrpE [Alkalicoccus halolimnae]
MYDVIGDIHGCRKELHDLLEKLGYQTIQDNLHHPENRMPVFLGDLTDRGPDSLGVINDTASWVENGQALYCPGNHCDKLYRFLLGRNVQVRHGLETTVAELENSSSLFRQQIEKKFKKLYEEAPLYLVLDGGGLVVAHAGIRYSDIGRMDKSIKSFVLYGDVTGEKDDRGMPVRRDWASIYPQGKATIVYGHTPVLKPRIIGSTINIDTGCVYGGKLTACRYPEKEFTDVPSSLPRVEEKFRTFM